MTTTGLVSDLQRDEGLRLIAYPDPVSGGDPWTIGYGHTGPEVQEGLVWSPEQALSTLADDIDAAEAYLDAKLNWWRSLDDVRQDVLAEMAFNLGIEGLLGFTRTLAAIRAGDFPTASADMLLSKWASEVGERATRLAAMMRTGARSP